MVDRYTHLLYRVFRKIYFFFNKKATWRNIEINKPGAYRASCDRDINNLNRLIGDAILEGSPFMVARFGNTEMSVIANQYEITHQMDIKITDVLDYIKGKRLGWWIDQGWRKNIKELSGFFPLTDEMIGKFYNLMLVDMTYVDILASWIKYEDYFKEELKRSYKIALCFEEMFKSNTCWTKCLSGKNVLVVHPFADTIKKQYNKRKEIWPNGVLPTFKLETIKAIQSLGGNEEFQSWFAALDFMKNEIDKVDYDVCLLGCGAYGFPLAAHVKRRGKVAIHVGGALQLLFGIKGQRWDKDFVEVYNDSWVRPSINEKPANASKVEGACYW